MISTTVFLLSPNSRPIRRWLRPSATRARNFGSEAVGFRPLSGLAAEALAARLRRGDAGADALLPQFAFEISDAGDDRRHRAGMQRRQVEGLSRYQS